MASWITWRQPTNPAYEELVEKATSPLNLPYPQSEDIALNLEICDMIRSKAVPPKAAMQSLKIRIASKNGRVQMSALGLIDTCIKNGGDHFLQEIASKEFVDEMVGMLKSPSTNPQVRDMALKVFQQWALAFESKRELSFLPEMYRELKTGGISFPPPLPTLPSAALLSTATPPTWIDSDSCMRCRTPFSFTNRKHHCRNCGLVFDQQCSSKMMPLPNLGIMMDVRVCEGCWTKSGKGKLSKNDPATPAVPSKRTPRSAHDMDADLQRAIALSLAEAHPSGSNASGSRPGYVPSQPGRKLEGVDEEDEELRMAIEASLAEMEKVRPSAPGEAEEQEYKPLPTYDLSPREAETMLTFAQTIEHAVGFGDQDLRRFPHAHGLHDQANMLSGKLHRNIEEKSTKQQMLAEMNDRLLQAIRRYDSLLTEQDTYSRRQAEIKREQRQQQLAQYGAYGQTPNVHQFPYPAQPNGPERSTYESSYSGYNVPFGSQPYAQQQHSQALPPLTQAAPPSMYPSLPAGMPPQAAYPSEARYASPTPYPQQDHQRYPEQLPPNPPMATSPSRQSSLQVYPSYPVQQPQQPHHSSPPLASHVMQSGPPPLQPAENPWNAQHPASENVSAPQAEYAPAVHQQYQPFPEFPEAPSGAFPEPERKVQEQPKEALLIDLF